MRTKINIVRFFSKEFLLSKILMDTTKRATKFMKVKTRREKKEMKKVYLKEIQKAQLTETTSEKMMV